jgi:hypothetical protein
MSRLTFFVGVFKKMINNVARKIFVRRLAVTRIERLNLGFSNFEDIKTLLKPSTIGVIINCSYQYELISATQNSPSL